LSEEEFKEYHTRKDLRIQYDDIIYFLNTADKIVKDKLKKQNNAMFFSLLSMQ